MTNTQAAKRLDKALSKLEKRLESYDEEGNDFLGDIIDDFQIEVEEVSKALKKNA